MLDSGESQKEVIRPDFNRAINIDFQGAQVTSDTGFLLLREIDDRFKIIAPKEECLEDLRSSTHTKHSLIQMVQQRGIGFVVTNSRLPPGKVIKVYNGRAEIENRIKEGKNTLRWDKTSCQRFEADQARLTMGLLAYNLLHMIRQFYVWGEEVKRSIDWLIKRLIKVGARVSYHARRGYVHVASVFPLARHYRAVLAWGT